MSYTVKSNSWAVLTFSYHTRRWDYWCCFPTLKRAVNYCVGKFGDGPTQRIVRINAGGNITRIIRRGKPDQLSETKITPERHQAFVRKLVEVD